MITFIVIYTGVCAAVFGAAGVRLGIAHERQQELHRRFLMLVRRVPMPPENGLPNPAQVAREEYVQWQARNN